MPRSHLSRFDLFIGTWNTTGEVLETEAGPAGQLVATDTYRWLPGRHFIAHEVDARFDGKPSRSLEIMGYDTHRRRYVSTSYDDQGVTDNFVLALHGRRWRIDGEKVRFRGGFDAAGGRLTGLWEIKGRKAVWQPWIRLQLARA